MDGQGSQGQMLQLVELRMSRRDDGPLVGRRHLSHCPEDQKTEYPICLLPTFSAPFGGRDRLWTLDPRCQTLQRGCSEVAHSEWQRPGHWLEN